VITLPETRWDFPHFTPSNTMPLISIIISDIDGALKRRPPVTAAAPQEFSIYVHPGEVRTHPNSIDLPRLPSSCQLTQVAQARRIGFSEILNE
ncbi:hypothetical protein, partial [Burkholderia alba]|uniref:hypothetical protein n=1 Tax=Burkholderia alba TaxID=2683677 RepID=UPI002B05F543